MHMNACNKVTINDFITKSPKITLWISIAIIWGKYLAMKFISFVADYIKVSLSKKQFSLDLSLCAGFS